MGPGQRNVRLPPAFSRALGFLCPRCGRSSQGHGLGEGGRRRGWKETGASQGCIRARSTPLVFWARRRVIQPQSLCVGKSPGLCGVRTFRGLFFLQGF